MDCKPIPDCQYGFAITKMLNVTARDDENSELAAARILSTGEQRRKLPNKHFNFTLKHSYLFTTTPFQDIVTLLLFANEDEKIVLCEDFGAIEVESMKF